MDCFLEAGIGIVGIIGIIGIVCMAFDKKSAVTPLVWCMGIIFIGVDVISFGAIVFLDGAIGAIFIGTAAAALGLRDAAFCCCSILSNSDMG